MEKLARQQTESLVGDSKEVENEENTHHSMACLTLELGRSDRLPETLGFNSATPTVITPIPPTSEPANTCTLIRRFSFLHLHFRVC